jgi:hypothetical protein
MLALSILTPAQSVAANGKIRRQRFIPAPAHRRSPLRGRTSRTRDPSPWGQGSYEIVIPVGAHSVGEASEPEPFALGTRLLRNPATIQPSAFNLHPFQAPPSGTAQASSRRYDPSKALQQPAPELVFPLSDRLSLWNTSHFRRRSISVGQPSGQQRWRRRTPGGIWMAICKTVDTSQR